MYNELLIKILTFNLIHVSCNEKRTMTNKIIWKQKCQVTLINIKNNVLNIISTY